MPGRSCRFLSPFIVYFFGKAREIPHFQYGTVIQHRFAAKQTEDLMLIAADHRKIGRVGFARVCERADNISLVTDGGADENALTELEGSGWGIIRA